VNPQKELEEITNLARQIPIPRSVADGHIDSVWEESARSRWSWSRPASRWATFALTAGAAFAVVSVGLVAHRNATTPNSPSAGAGISHATPSVNVILPTSTAPPALTAAAPPSPAVKSSANPPPGPSSPALPTPTPAPVPPVTFGFDPGNPVAFSGDDFIHDRKRVNAYSISASGSISKLSIWLHPTSTSGSQTLEGIIYSDASNNPGQLVAVTQRFTFTSSDAQGWYDLKFSTPVVLNPGKYWIGVLTSGTDHVTGYHYNPVPGARYYNSNVFTAGPSQNFGSSGTITTDNEQMLLYAH
jgi:hypothetical protein